MPAHRAHQRAIKKTGLIVADPDIRLSEVRQKLDEVDQEAQAA